MALVRKQKKDAGKHSSINRIIKVNPYENPETVMGLMAKICSVRPSAETDIFWKIINDAYAKKLRGLSFSEYLQENRYSLYDKDFQYDLENYLQQISWTLSERENTGYTQIVVAGGFSSGKSSFLNRLTSSSSLLPTGVEPVSVVKTYLYCSKNNKSIKVKGINLKNVLVDLDLGVLQAIQHAKESNIYLASVLDKLFVEIPNKELDGIVFIDTPGYNNSEKANKSNGKTDKETALEAMSEGNVLFWLIDCERGTTVSDDIELIKQFKGRKVIIFNKADKKGEAESAKIVESAAKTLYKEFSKEEIIDIIAFSTLDNKIYYSKNRMRFAQILKSAKSFGNGINEQKRLRDLVGMLFDLEILESEKYISSIEEDYKKKVEDKNILEKSYRDYKNAGNKLSDELANHYKELSDVLDSCCASSSNILSRFIEFYNGVCNFEENDHWGSSSILDRAISRANNTIKNCRRDNDTIKYSVYKKKYRGDLVQRAKEMENLLEEKAKEWYENAIEECEELLKSKESEEMLIKDMREYKRNLMAAIDLGIAQYNKKNRAATVYVADTAPYIYDCIRKDDYKSFLRSFEKGVDVAQCNADGYNPLTYAVESGNNNMVKFLLNNGADPAIKDNRGYNAFHTAVENQYRDICKMLLDFDEDLIYTKTSKGESVEDLATRQTFSKWIENEIYNAL
ncbi:ankyrin repeat domain-containing protein [Prevotella sp. HUN102]|uniref:ankyrin repeat domain-containing protein n=1 Tax=Prevotella sp. HUN102 TaxID=1392486 RepID=UPI00048E6BC5|nr:ankyrin repeat domain-containing protein [Prevotella sp. HUN102]